jgi:DNA-binding NtrC family response regulator
MTGERILIVEDNSPLGRMLAGALSLEGFDAVHVHDMDAAVQHMKGNVHPDVVLLDLTLNGERDPEIIDRVHKHCPDVPVVVVTGDDSRSTYQECIEAGAHAVIVKAEKFAHESIYRAVFSAIHASKPHKMITNFGKRLGRIWAGEPEQTLPPQAFGVTG